MAAAAAAGGSGAAAPGSSSSGGGGGASSSSAAASSASSSPAAASSSSASSAAGAAAAAASNPRKFSEKIALQKQRQAEETAAFEEVMMELGTTRLHAQKLRLAHSRGPYYGGSLPNVNQIGSCASEFQGPLHSPLDSARGTRHHGLVERVQRDPRRMISPLRRYVRQIDSSPYSPAYLSPPAEPSWKRTMPWSNFPVEKERLFRLPASLNRTNSDSALHTSVMNPNPQNAYMGPSQAGPPPNRKSGYLDADTDSKVFLFQVPSIEESLLDDGKQSLKPWDTKKLSSSSARPRSCEVPGIHIFPSPDQPANLPLIPSTLNTGGSLPDLTNLHFPSPLPTPLDPEESAYPSLSGGSSTGNLASTMTHLGISGGMGLGHGYDPPGEETSPILSPLSHHRRKSLEAAMHHGLCSSMQSSLSNPCLQSSLNAPALRPAHSPLGGQSMPSSLSTPSLSTSLSNPSLPTSLSAHTMPPVPANPRLPPPPHPHHQPPPNFGGPASSSSSSSSTASSPAASYTPLNASPRRRVPLSPLTLPMAGDARRQHPKQFSPTMSPTLSSITQGVPLDTSKLSADQRLPPYPYSHPGVLQHSQTSQHPVSGGVPTSPQNRQPSQPPCPYPTHYQPNSMPQHQFNQPLGDFGFGNFDQYGFVDNMTGGFAFNSNTFAEDMGALNYSPSYNMGPPVGGGGGHSSNSTAMNDPHLLGRQNMSNCSRHGPIPNIILTGDSSPGISKEIASVLAGMPGFEMDAASLGLDEDLKIEPLSLDGLNMLSDPYVLLTDPSVEDSFRTDRLQ